ncbi:hypothetical protein [Neoroseomonas oryzicola]|uniref:Uncharacterized protein n=1 Tax=Neoroseomonas oryzicola TaxID=535904 RepID=A0A9X9WJ63_9PROT|nr:hypothetical protein [Neoroseomonas oryzicola]MBR0660373.1 hypothetical protein [Neoroseomonas oryzicola]NKE18339.1 hypothetical protein [Neoroseomonas oryzicola]
MAYLAAALVAILGLAAAVLGGAFAMALARLRRPFREALRDESPDGVRARAAKAVEAIRNPLLKRIVTRRIGEMIGVAVVKRLVEQLDAAVFWYSALAVLGCAAVLFSFFVPRLFA